VLRLSGDVRWILGIERTVLNALMHLSGVATATARAVEAVRASGGDVAVYATRKTLPGLRELEKAAVVHGGGHPHRRDLADGFLAKSPHLELVPIPEAVVRLRRAAGRHRSVQIEVRTAAEALSAVGAGADALLIDNAGPARSRTIVEALDRAGLRSKVWIEISGGITLRSVGRYARSGADAVSLGALTHSAAAVPFHLRLELPRGSPRT
jgi:nicotinate-nucleotide pyrophosphorylase (carboxylating)